MPIEKVEGELWDTVLLDDDDHTYDYVISMLHAIFGYPHVKCFLLTREVDTTGRVIVFRGSKRRGAGSRRHPRLRARPAPGPLQRLDESDRGAFSPRRT